MKAQLVYENLDFERGISPKKALGIGISWENVGKGSILEAKKSMYLTSTGRISSKGIYDQIAEGAIMVLTDDIGWDHWVEPSQWILSGDLYLKLEDYQSPGKGYRWGEVRGKPGTIKNRFKILGKE